MVNLVIWWVVFAFAGLLVWCFCRGLWVCGVYKAGIWVGLGFRKFLARRFLVVLGFWIWIRCWLFDRFAKFGVLGLTSLGFTVWVLMCVCVGVGGVWLGMVVFGIFDSGFCGLAVGLILTFVCVGLRFRVLVFGSWIWILIWVLNWMFDCWLDWWVM